MGDFALILHSHLPWVLGHGRWPHGSDWLNEIVMGCYLPLLETADALLAEGLTPAWTLDLSPVLCEQLAHPDFAREFVAFAANRIAHAEEDRAAFARGGDEAGVALADFWLADIRRQLERFERTNGNVVAAFRALEERGAVEIITCAATHGYLPLLGRDASIDLQLRVATATHERHFGRRPRGIWLPECAYRPRYGWTVPAGPHRGEARGVRPGIEEWLAARGLRYFVTDLHMVQGGAPISTYRERFPALATLAVAVDGPPRRGPRTADRTYRVASAGGRGEATALIRDPGTTVQVWSRHHGYPGDPWYLEFHKKHFPGGGRYWRVTDADADLADKQRYEPERAAARAAAHADHFANLARGILAAGDHPGGLLCSPYDTELFGHWWFEGPRFLREVARRLPRHGVRALTASAAIEAHPPEESTTMLEGSWGEGGDHRVWLNPATEWTWGLLYGAEDDFWGVARTIPWASDVWLRRIVAQMARELLLLQASDWQFLITTQSARDYAETRFAAHYADLTRLGRLARARASGDPTTEDDVRFVEAKEAQDAVFPDIVETLAAMVATPGAGVRPLNP